MDNASGLLPATRWQKALFVLPAFLLTFAMVIFPTVFGILVSFTGWTRTGTTLEGASSGFFLFGFFDMTRDIAGAIRSTWNGFGNFREMAGDNAFRTALSNNLIFAFVGVPLQYLVALGLALLLNQQIRGRKLFRVAFLLPFMISPIAVGWMIGKAMFDARFGPFAKLARDLDITLSFYDTGFKAVFWLIMINAWYAIPFVMVMLLAGLQAMPVEVFEAAKIDGAGRWRTFWDMTFPLLLPVSLTAVVLRIVFEFKLIDIIYVVTGGGPGDASQTLSLYIYKEGYLSGNIGYATAMAEVFLIFVIVIIVALLATIGRRVRSLY
ncbi:MAG: sugar ABC transporter permease [Chloroflexia bacterium]|jgi:multiple sugar transport system permease protein|nr:sugar ABC transporter permease [Chloroflexia bacterium]MDQ3525668.1 sugar ABC transporter permease [Chloroflexota bacterium]